MTTNALLAIALIAVLLLMDSAHACSFAPGYRIVTRPPDIAADAHVVPPAPRVSVLSVQRGYGTGDGASCNDAGLLMLGLDGGLPPDAAGYIFRIARGDFPDTLFPDAVLLPVEFDNGIQGFGFVWLDLERGSSHLRPVDLVIEVRQVATNGAASAPALLHIHDPGSAR